MRAAEAVLASALTGYLTRTQAVLLSRLGGPRARRGTRWWQDRGGGVALEVKAVDVDYALPDRLVAEVEQALRPVAIQIAVDAAAETARRLAARNGAAPLDQAVILRAVDDVVGALLTVARQHAARVRETILRADANAETLEQMLGEIEQAYRKGGNWVLMAGRTLATALLNEAALEQARALGVTHAQWLSRRDGAVRPTHRRADGQVRELLTPFSVGRFALRFPADPADLPASWPEVGQCRCGLLFAPPDPTRASALRLARNVPGSVVPGAQSLLAARSGASVRTTLPVVGYRVLQAPPPVAAGQRLVPPDVLTLGLAAPAISAVVLTVVIPAGVTLLVMAGVVSLPPATELEVLSADAAGITARVVTAGDLPENGETPPR